MRGRISSLTSNAYQVVELFEWLDGKVRKTFLEKAPAVVKIPQLGGYFQREAEDRDIRIKLKNLDKRRNVSRVKTLVLHGPAGHGKTCSAANLMNQLNTGPLSLRISGGVLRSKPTILWTILANDHEGMLESYRSLATEIGLKEEANDAKQEISLLSRTSEGRQYNMNLQSQCNKTAYDEALRQIYENVRKKLKLHRSWVLLIENPSEDISSRFWPRPGDGNSGNGLVIVTTQNPELLTKEGDDYPLDKVKIGKMAKKDAVEFFANKSGIRLTVSDNIAVILSQWVPEDIARFAKSAREYKEETGQEFNFKDFPLTESATVAECMLILEMSSRKNQAKLLKFLACCSSEKSLPLEILKKHFTEAEEAAEDSEFVITPPETKEGLKVVTIDQRVHDTLKNLLTREEESTAGLVTWMDSFKDKFKKKGKPLSSTIQKLTGLEISQVMKCLASVCKDALQHCRDEDYSMLRLTLPHLKEAVQLSSQQTDIEPLAMAEGHACLGESLLFFGESKEATTQLKIALDLYKNNKGPENVQLDLANVLHFFGEAYSNRHLGYPSKGERFLREALSLKEELFNGKAHPQVAFTLRGLGHALNERGKHSEAMEHIQRALAIYDDCETFRQEYGFTLSELGSSYRYLGQYVQAECCLKEALQIFRSVNIPSNLRIGETLSRLSSVQRNMDKLDESIVSLNEARRLFENNDIYRAGVLSKLSVAYRYKGDSENSLEFAKKAKEISDKQHGAKDHPAIATALLNLGHAQSDIGDVAEAMRNLNKAMDIYVALHGENHRIVAATLNYLGYVYQQMGMVQEGKKKLERAVEITGDFGFHPEKANSLKRLSKACLTLGETVKSAQLACTALKIYQKTYENTMEHREVRKCKVRVAYASSKIGLFDKAKEYLREVELGFPEEKIAHPEYAALLQKKTEVTLDSFGFNGPSDEKKDPKVLSKANRDLNKAEKIVSNSLGSEHQQFALITKEKARLSILMGDYQDAFSKMNLLIPNICHHFKADFYLVKSDAEKELDFFTAEKESLERAENIYRDTFGEDHPMLALTLQKLCTRSLDLKKIQDAYKYFEESGQACERIVRNLKEQRECCDTDFLKNYNTDVHPIVKRQQKLEDRIRGN